MINTQNLYEGGINVLLKINKCGIWYFPVKYRCLIKQKAVIMYESGPADVG